MNQMNGIFYQFIYTSAFLWQMLKNSNRNFQKFK